ncbi:hypothetical protein [Aeromicrobium sp. UC242_57]|uniref:hypothetical protein n=1 Tax=Aeromicrobium sp. UC242_57 TaxID=3374624 RepID=UPI0037BA19B2
MVVFGGSYGIGGDIAELARGFGANVGRSRGRRPTRTSTAAKTSPPLRRPC